MLKDSYGSRDWTLMVQDAGHMLANADGGPEAYDVGAILRDLYQFSAHGDEAWVRRADPSGDDDDFWEAALRHRVATPKELEAALEGVYGGLYGAMDAADLGRGHCPEPVRDAITRLTRALEPFGEDWCEYDHPDRYEALVLKGREGMHVVVGRELAALAIVTGAAADGIEHLRAENMSLKNALSSQNELPMTYIEQAAALHGNPGKTRAASVQNETPPRPLLGDLDEVPKYLVASLLANGEDDTDFLSQPDDMRAEDYGATLCYRLDAADEGFKGVGLCFAQETHPSSAREEIKALGADAATDMRSAALRLLADHPDVTDVRVDVVQVAVFPGVEARARARVCVGTMALHAGVDRGAFEEPTHHQVQAETNVQTAHASQHKRLVM